MADANETRSAPIGIRVFPSVKAAAKKAAAADQRTVASLVEKLLVEWLRKSGYLKATKVDDGNPKRP